jgi:hypothetical protein
MDVASRLGRRRRLSHPGPGGWLPPGSHCGRHPG